MQRIVIHVEGGLVQAVYCRDTIEVVIIDFDNDEEEQLTHTCSDGWPTDPDCDVFRVMEFEGIETRP